MTKSLFLALTLILLNVGWGYGQTATIGSQVWSTQNLNVSNFRNGDPIPEARTPEAWMAAGENGQPAWCYYQNDGSNGSVFGKLYNWHAVNDPRGLAPVGWHIPKEEEWYALKMQFGEDGYPGTALKSTSLWKNSGNGTNSSGFNGLPGGLRHADGTFEFLYFYGVWWSATATGSLNAWYHELGHNASGLSRADESKMQGFSVRCIKDNPVSIPNHLKAGESLPIGHFLQSENGVYKLVMQDDGNLVIYNKNTGWTWATWTQGKKVKSCIFQADGNLVLYDEANVALWHSNSHNKGGAILHLGDDGNLVIYDKGNLPIWSSAPRAAAEKSVSSNDTKKDVTIGTQIWMTKNLDVDRFRNGDPIPQAKTNEEWATAGINRQPAWCYYDNDPVNGEKYGKLYNGYALRDPRGLAPEGYHVPTDGEWTILTDYLGGLSVAGEKMKSSTAWEENCNGTNESGFSGLPGGERLNDGTFSQINKIGMWWSSTISNPGSSWIRYLGNAYYQNNIYDVVERRTSSLYNGRSVRCLKD